LLFTDDEFARFIETCNAVLSNAQARRDDLEPVACWSVPADLGASDDEPLYVLVYDNEDEPIALRHRFPGDDSRELGLTESDAIELRDALNEALAHHKEDVA